MVDINRNDTRKLERVVYITALPTDPGENASYALAYDTDGNCTQIEKTIDGRTFRQTLTWSGGNATAVSTWATT